MKIVLSNHALIKISQRKISKILIVDTIRNPDFTRPSRNFREEKYKKFNKNYLKVVTIQNNREVVVITVHWVAKIKSK